MRISTDVIVGFPGETEKDFELTKSAFQQSAFEMAFIFKYSERSGTKAVSLSNIVPTEIKERRNQELLSLLRTQSEESNSKSLGRKFEILVEAKAKKGINMFMGRTRCNRKVVFEGDITEIGTLKYVTIKETSATTLTGVSV
jgi:tRNA-2-methylthio-N6-dimethylallyladenosine synthase